MVSGRIHPQHEGIPEAQTLIEDQEFSPAIHTEGIRHYYDSLLKDPSTRIDYNLKTPIDKFGQHGVGLQLYFELMRALCITFLVISICSILPIYDNFKGGYLLDGDLRYFFDELTLANQDGPRPNDSLEDAEDTVDDTEVQRRRVVYPDIFYTIIFFVGLTVYRIHSAKVIARNKAKNVATANYAIEVHNLPEDVEESTVRRHFSQFGTVCEVFLSRKNMRILVLYRAREALSRELKRLQFMAANGEKIEPKKLAKAEQKLKECNDNIKAKQALSSKTFNELPVERGFVVFNIKQERDKCARAYKKERCLRLFRGLPANLKLEGKSLKVKSAKDPSTIQWENLDQRICMRLGLRLAASVLTVVLLVVSIIILYLLKTTEDDLPDSKECENDGIVSDISLDEAENEPYNYHSQYETYCWCKGQSFTQIASDSDKYDYCSDYMQKTYTTRSLKVLTSLALLFINFMFKILMTRLTKIERHSNLVMEKVSILSKVFLVCFINTALINLLVNADLQSWEFVKSLPFRDYILNTEFKDFSRTWYVKVGATFVLTMALSIGSPHGLYLLIMYPLAWFKRRFWWKKHRIQGDLNQMMIGPEFTIEVHTAVNLNIVFTCFLYSSGMPIMNFICFFALLIRYWVEKWLVLRYYRKPPIYKEEINNRALSILPFAGMLHCLFGLYMYGTEDIFPKGYHLNSDNKVEGDEESLSDRMQVDSGIVLLVLVAIGLAIWLIDAILHRLILRVAIKVFKLNIVQTIEFIPFTDVVDVIKSRGIASYNIMNNPAYAPLVNSMNDLAAEIMRAPGVVLNSPATVLPNDRDQPRPREVERDSDVVPRDQPIATSQPVRDNASDREESPRSEGESGREPIANEGERSISEVSSDQPGPHEMERDSDFSSKDQLVSSMQPVVDNALGSEEPPKNEEEVRREPSASMDSSHSENSADQLVPQAP
jgi:RNA recognition motif-containing protein